MIEKEEEQRNGDDQDGPPGAAPGHRIIEPGTAGKAHDKPHDADEVGGDPRVPQEHERRQGNMVQQAAKGVEPGFQGTDQEHIPDGVIAVAGHIGHQHEHGKGR